MKQTFRVFYCLSLGLLWSAAFTGFYSVTNRSINFVYAAEPDGETTYIAPFVPTPQEVVDRMLELAQLSKGDILYDLGSGDGRIVITAARRYGIKAIGFEIDAALVKHSQRAITEAGLENLAEIREQDIRNVDLSQASVVTMYLYPGANLRLRGEILRQMKAGSRVVSHDFSMGSWTPDKTEQMRDSTGLLRTIYLWRIKGKNTQ